MLHHRIVYNILLYSVIFHYMMLYSITGFDISYISSKPPGKASARRCSVCGRDQQLRPPGDGARILRETWNK